MSGAMAEVLRLSGSVVDGARALLEAPGFEPLPVASALLLAGLGVALVWRRPEAGWPSTDGAARVPGGWSPDGGMRAATGFDAAGVLDAATPGGGE